MRERHVSLSLLLGDGNGGVYSGERRVVVIVVTAESRVPAAAARCGDGRVLLTMGSKVRR